MEINKVKYDYKKGTVDIDYTLERENSEDDIKVHLCSRDKPLDTFAVALNCLAPYVEKICQFADGYCESAEVRSVSFSHTNGIMGAVITALIPVSTANSQVIVNTPHLPSEGYSDSEDFKAPVLPSACVDMLEVLIEEATRYINGERQIEEDNQLELFEEKEVA